MNTYVIHIKNKSGYEWVAENGETEIVEAASLEEALNHLSLILEGLSDSVYDHLREDLNAPTKNIANMHLPLDFAVSEIPAIGKILTDADIKNALQLKIDDMYVENRAIVIAERLTDSKKQQSIAKLKTEAAKLGLSLDDLV